MIRSPAGFDGEDRIKRYLDYYQPSYGVMMLSAGQFSPLQLFASGEQGVWYDPSDMTTLFQDSAGTTPVTAVEQPVGLILDKSKGLTRETDLRDTGVALLVGTAPAASYNTSTGVGSVSRALDANNQSYVAFGSLTSTKYYYFSIQNTGATGLVVRLNSPSGTVARTVTAGASFAGYLTNGTSYVVTSQNNSTTATFTVLAIYAVSGNHASQSTSASRPVLKQDANGKYYLLFDGIDDSLATGTITPGTDKAQVFAGVRKLSDAATSILVEYSADVGANAGSLYISVNESLATKNYGFKSRGSVNPIAPVTSGTYVSPISNVITGTGDISGDSSILRINTTQIATSSADQGTGNYLAYPLYIGRRAGTSLPFNGQLYSLIARFGANLPNATIAQTETWVNGKTGAY